MSYEQGGRYVSTMLCDLFWARAAASPAAPALWIRGQAFAYGQLREMSWRIATSLRTDEAQRERPRVALFAYRSAWAYAGVLGVLGAGSAYVPLNPRFPLERTRRMLELADVHAMIVDTRCEAQAAQVLAATQRPLLVLLPGHQTLPAWTLAHPQHRYLGAWDMAEARAPHTADAGTLAYLLFTSGSTGVPKAIGVTHHNALSYVKNLERCVAFDESDRFTQLFDLTFDLSVHDMFVCWNAGACLYVVDESALLAPAKLVRDQALTVWFSVPSTASFMARLGMLAPGGLPSLRSALFCGEALPVSLAQSFRLAAANARVFNLYGPTETTIAITAYDFTHAALDTQSLAVPIGSPLPGQATRIVGSDLLPVPEGQCGELYLRGSQVTPGYFRNPELTRKAFVMLPQAAAHEDPSVLWYRTGDLASQHPQHGLLFHGRVDQQIKIRGFRVEVQEIEAVLREAAKTQEVAVIGWPHSADEGTLGTVAFLAGSCAGEAALLQACRKQLPDYMVPGQFRLLSALPLNANGKVDHGALEALLEAPEPLPMVAAEAS